jgi:Protein of unknown function (DUF2852)
MDLAARIDDFGKPAWIALMIVGFLTWWPMGLAILIYLIGSGRMSCWKRGGWGRWQREGRDRAQRWQGRWNGPWTGPSSGNRAFDDYRAETLRRLEDEQRDFMEFLDRLRHAKDKAEFDQFMAERSRRPQGPDQGPEPQPQA